MIRKFVRLAFLSLILLFLSLLLFELCYRYQIIDFYAKEFRLLNPRLEEQFEREKTILIFGDSFSAFPGGYVEQLRIKYPNYRIINCSVAGIGIKQHELFFTKRVKQYQPDLILYQFYVGNDLLDVKQDYNWSESGLIRFIYQVFSDQFLSLKYLNYKLAYFRTSDFTVENKVESKNYNPRVRKYFAQHPNYLEETILLKGDQKAKFEEWQNIFQSMLSELDPQIKMKLLLLPHCVQVNHKYQKTYRFFAKGISSSLLQETYPLEQAMQSILNIPIINPLTLFQQKDIAMPIYFSDDPHLNLKGQTVLFEYLVNHKALE